MKSSALIASSAAAFMAATALTASPALALDGVITSIKPIHSLVAGVMDGVGEPELLVKGAASPHTYTLRPSDAAMLQDAPLVFWVGPGLEPFLDQPLDTLSANARVVTLEQTEGMTRLEFREGGAFEAHDHGDHGDSHAHEEHAHDDHDHSHDDHDHSHDDHGHNEDHHHEQGHDHAEEAGAAQDHGHEDHAAHDHSSDDHAGHDHSGTDPHYWLDPENAKLMVGVIEAALADADPDNADTYRTNAEALTARIDELATEIAATVEPVADRPFIVFHDAYHYFENRFGLQAAGAITISPEVAPGAERISELRQRVNELDAACVFAEPQFEPRIVNVVIEGTDAKAGVLDPEGAEIADGPDLYFELLRNMATSFTTCLGEES